MRRGIVKSGFKLEFCVLDVIFCFVIDEIVEFWCREFVSFINYNCI